MTLVTKEIKTTPDGKVLLTQALRLRSIVSLLGAIQGYVHTDPSPEGDARMLKALSKAIGKFT